MKRAAILIGVSKAGPLPELQAVVVGIQGMRAWALSQEIAPELIRTITDEVQSVTPTMLSASVRELCDRGDIEQLVVYFAGHGVVIGYNEYWLLSDAIVDANAAVNLSGSEELARRGLIPHVIFVSDACRTAAAGIQAQGIQGSIIFPNNAPSGAEKAVDIFFATAIGDPALEIADQKASTRSYKAMYTALLLEALQGRFPVIAEEVRERELALIRPRPLKRLLAKELPIRVFEATAGANPRSQLPDARITSDDDAWISFVSPSALESSSTKFGGAPSSEANAYAEIAADAVRRREQIVREVLRTTDASIEDVLTRLYQEVRVDATDHGSLSARDDSFTADAIRYTESFGPLEFETHCGFKIRGATVRNAAAVDAFVEILDSGAIVRVNIPKGVSASVLLTLESGVGVLLPAIPQFLGSLTFDQDHLNDVAFEPSHNTARWSDYQHRYAELRVLRAVIASSSRLGAFHLEVDDSDQLSLRMQYSFAKQMQYSKAFDPSLAIYAAHAFRDLGKRERLKEMAWHLLDDLGFLPFDVALLAGDLNGSQVVGTKPPVCPFLPLLSQSWALLPTSDFQPPPILRTIARRVTPSSLWTVYDSEGVRLLSDFIHEGKVQ